MLIYGFQSENNDGAYMHVIELFSLLFMRR